MSYVEKKIEYHDGDDILEGVLAFPPGSDNSGAKLTPVIVFHAFAGITEFEEGRTVELAKLGFLAFAADVYGKGKRGTTREENVALMTPYRQNRSTLLKNRLLAALNYVKSLDFVDTTKICAVGYCFGGLCVLDLARYNVGLAAVVSFHGGLDPIPDAQPPETLDPIETSILVCHGDGDTHIPVEKCLDFMKEMRARKADWQFVTYANAKHGFTEPKLANSTMEGIGYDEKAAKRSWTAMLNLFAEYVGNLDIYTRM
uniref:Dienelactone hydrolase domain-containing protein n=1 Tax=Acrobeloides nanus TaxID=290746 RepID=A0A914C0V6_9BILA